jgi:hypothetical protein
MTACTLLLISTAIGGLISGPDDAYQLRFDETWYAVGEHELGLEADPHAVAVELLGAIPVGEHSLTMAIRDYIEDRKPGTETSTETFTGLGGREGAVIHTTRMRKLTLQQLSWAAMPLGDGTAALVVQRVDGSAQSSVRESFLEAVGTALPPGILVDAPTAELEEIYRAAMASPDDLVELRGLFYENGALRGELVNGSDRVLNRAVLDVQVRDADGRHLAERLVEVVPGPDRRALGAGASLRFHIDLTEGGAAPAGIGGARVETLVWAEGD